MIQYVVHVYFSPFVSKTHFLEPTSSNQDWTWSTHCIWLIYLLKSFVEFFTFCIWPVVCLLVSFKMSPYSSFSKEKWFSDFDARFGSNLIFFKEYRWCWVLLIALSQEVHYFWLFLWAEMCPCKLICWRANSQYPRMWLCLEIKSLKRGLS